MTRARILMAVLILLAPLAGHADGFLSIEDDLPLMPGLAEVPEGGIVFDTAEGRLAETQATGALAAPQVLEFYAAALPELGWTRLDDATFRRDAELLRLQMAPTAAGVAVRFSISPISGGNKTK
ncbi:MAG: hypothetical protein H7841_15200 [Magnetospirillum sp. WYHS-4]